nr:DENN domain-containing protein 2B-like isoform X3 [Nerophis lumbriciformis]
MSLCLDKRPGRERIGGSEGCPSLLSSPCSEKTFDFKGIRRMSTAFSECSYTETEEEEGASEKDGLGRFQKRISKTESSGAFVRSLSARKETSAVLNRIQKIEQALKENPSPPSSRYLNNCYASDKTRQKSFVIGDDFDNTCTSKRSSVCSVATEPDTLLMPDKLAKHRQRFSVASVRSVSPDPASQQTSAGPPINPLPKPRRTFEYEAKREQKVTLSVNGLPLACDSPPPLPSTPAPIKMRTVKLVGSTSNPAQDREPSESEDATSLLSSHPSSPAENGTLTTEMQSQPNSKCTLEENAYEDIIGKHPKENPYEDVDLKRRSLVRKTCHLESSRSWTAIDRKENSPPQLPSKPSSQSLRLMSTNDRNSHRVSQLSKRHSHDETLFLPQMGVSTSSCGLLDDSLCGTGDNLTSHRHWRIPKPSGKGPRLPEVYCVISRLGCFDLFSTILDEVERRRGVSAALVYPFMRSLMESPFPAPGKLIKVKTFLPGAGNEVIELRRPTDSRLEHVDFDSLFGCLGVRQVIRVFASLLLERRVIFVADKLSMLSSCMHAVVALLYPFSWQHTFIPVLPGSMLDIVCCPTPFLVGLLSSSLPKLKELPVEEALMVDLGTDRFIRQMDDEASLLPRKLQAALEQALEQRNDIINQDSDSESDEEYNSLNSLVSEAFIRFFLETIGHYSLFITQNERGERLFQREAFRKSVASKSIRRFLGVFMESQMFAGFVQDRELRKTRAKGLFEQRVEQYLEELPDTEQSGVNKFLKGLGSKMKFLHKKN